MKTFVFKCLVAVVLMGGMMPSAMAIAPEEVLLDSRLDDRARQLYKQLRCLVCANQSIDDSDAELAVDLRLEVRKLLKDGKSDDDILAHLQNRFGDYILLKPPLRPATYLLWGMPFILLLLGGGIFILNRKNKISIQNLSSPKMNRHDTDSPPSPFIILMLGGFIILASLGLYLMLGRPDLKMQPLSGRQAELSIARQTELVRQNLNLENLNEARAEATRNPSSVEAQLIFAMAAAAAEDFKSEQDALDRLLVLTNRHPSITLLLAESISRSARGLVTLRARRLIDETLAKNPHEPRALYLKGLAAFQDDNHPLARAIWSDLLEKLPQDSPIRSELSRYINSLNP